MGVNPGTPTNPKTGELRAVLVGGTKRDYGRVKLKLSEAGIEIVKHFESDKSSNITIPPDCEGVLAIRWVSHSRFKNVAQQANKLGIPWTMIGTDVASSRKLILDLRKRAGFMPEYTPKPVTPVPVPEVTIVDRAPKPEKTDDPVKSTPIDGYMPEDVQTEEVPTPPVKRVLTASYLERGIRALLSTGQESVADVLQVITGQRNHPNGMKIVKRMVEDGQLEIAGKTSVGPLAGGRSGRIIKLASQDGRKATPVKTTKKKITKKTRTKKKTVRKDRMTEIIAILESADGPLSVADISTRTGLQLGRRSIDNYMKALRDSGRVKSEGLCPVRYSRVDTDPAKEGKKPITVYEMQQSRKRTGITRGKGITVTKSAEPRGLQALLLNKLQLQLQNPIEADKILSVLIQEGVLKL